MLNDLHVEAGPEPPSLAPHLSLVSQLEDVLNDKLRVEEGQHGEADLELVFCVEPIALGAEDYEE